MDRQQERKFVNRLRDEYTEHGETKLDSLKKMDRRIKRPAEIFAYTFGTAGTLILGTGMCLAMKVIGNLVPLGIAIGLIGIAMVAVNYFIYRHILTSRKKKYGARIIALSNELLGD